ncbi:hypothetical protein [Usitatibacter palustris]|uniref:DUF4760 domain-containing protein n=1 Tax=Usitatibacter palustris TaxID=2732487 RepID=A0A6M4HCC5_9PROT|nr:hypothetical protein [Usitatibacter palustris]QJR16715.1 hypothetical protein DSM104440_03551 [Usitatibacter palustris]
MTCQSVVALLSALLTPVIAIITTYIAWQQWQGNRQKLRFDQYEKRLRIYQEVVKILGHIMRDADVRLEDLMLFRANTAEADFLFGPEIPKYIEEVFTRGLALRTAMVQYRDAYQEKPPGYDHVAIVNESDKQLRWLTEQYEPAKQKFSKYLKVGAS